MQLKTKAKLKQLNSEAGFSLLELIAVMAVLGLLASSLGMTLSNQFRFWEFNSNRLQVINEIRLVSSYLSQDIAQATSYDWTGDELILRQDRTGNGNIERIVSYRVDSKQLERVLSYQDNLPEVDSTKQVLTTTFADFESKDSSNNHQLDLKLEFAVGDVEEKLTKSFYLGDRRNSRLNNSLEFDGNQDYVALEHYLAGADYEELTLLAKIRTTEESGVIYGFNENEYFSLGIANGNLNFKIAGEDFSNNDVINDGETYILAVTVVEDEVELYSKQFEDDEFDNRTEHNIFSNTFGSGNPSYGFLGVDSRASSFDGTRGNDYFEGQIYWLQHWDKALTEQQLDIYSSAILSGEEDGLKAYYPIKEQDEILYDYLGQNHGLVVGPGYIRD